MNFPHCSIGGKDKAVRVVPPSVVPGSEHSPGPRFCGKYYAPIKSLIDEGVDSGNDGEISQAEAQAVIYLNVSGENISDLAGIEYFTSLEVLYCDNNSLISLNVSGLTILQFLDCTNNFIYSIDIRNTPTLNQLEGEDNPDLECIVVDDLGSVPGNVSVDQNPIPYTTESCLSGFEGFPILVGSVGLPLAMETAIQGALKVAEASCSAGSKEVAISSLYTVILMTTRARQLGRLSAKESGQIHDNTRELIQSIRSGDLDCSGEPRNILDWFDSWFSLESPTETNAPEANATLSSMTIYPNPTAGRVNFPRTVAQVVVYNMMGQLMKKEDNVDHLDLSELKHGVYMVQLKNGNEQSVKQVVKR